MGRKANPNKVEKVKNKKEFVEDPSLAIFASKVMDDNKIDYLNQIKIKYVLVDQYCSKTVLGKVVKSSKELKFFADIDYVIQISKDIWDSFDDKGREMVMLHLLLHILITNNKDGDMVTKILGHDVNNFSTIINKYGHDEFKNLKYLASSLRDLDPAQTDKITI